MDSLTIKSHLGDYRVDVRDDAAWALELARTDNVVVVVDERVWALHRTGVLAAFEENHLHLMSATEESKTFEGVATLFDAMIARSAKRNSVVVSIGGGVVQDATGFLASVIYRGVAWTYVPTTLLAQGDSCIGSKTSINYRHFKNLLGTFYPPRQVIIHPQFAATLDDHQFASGLGEIIKMHIVAGRDSVERIKPDLEALTQRDPRAVGAAVYRSLRIKQTYVEDDEFDMGRRRLLNFGHCFGHAIESATDFAVPHGQAVVLGMYLAGLVSTERGLIERSALDDFAARMFTPALTTAAEADLDGAAVIEAMRHDKKRSGSGLAVVLPDRDWRLAVAEDVTDEEALRALATLPCPLAPTQSADGRLRSAGL